MNLYQALSAVDFRVRSGNSPELSGDFVGPDGTADSTYLTGSRELVSGGSFNPFHRYIQYEAKVYSDAVGSDTPYVNSVKFVTSDGVVAYDSSLADFQQAESVTLLTNYPARQATPYVGLEREGSGGFVSSGTYRSSVFDAGEGGFWQAVEWDLPADIATDTAGLVGLWRMNGSWADAIGGVIGVPSGATLITDTPKLGIGAARFDGTSSASFSLGKAVRSLEFWVAPNGSEGGLLELNPGSTNAANGRVAVVSANGVLRLEGTGAAGAQLFVNARDRSRELLPGWNHVALILAANVTVTNMTIGVAGGANWPGMMDELAVYSRALLKADAVQRVASGVPQAGGRVTAKARFGNALPLTGAFSGSYQSGQAIGIAGQRYFQYELELSGGGMVTPAVGQVRVVSSAGTFASRTRADFAKGDFGGLTTWHGDTLHLVDLADRGAVGLTAVGQTGLAALWKMDEASWTTAGAQVLDAAGSRHGSPVGGAATESAGGLGLYSGKFSGSGQYVALPAVSLPADFAVSIWFQGSSTNRAALVATELTGSRSYALELNGDGAAAAPGQLTLVLNGTGGQVLVPSLRRDLNDGRWHHVVAMRQGQQAHLVVDGVRENSGNISGAVEDYGAGPLFLARYGADAIYFAGALDDLSLWQRALTPGEIGRLSSAGYESARTADFESAILDAEGASIWETLDWTANGRFGSGLPSTDSGLLALWRGEESAGHLTNSVASGTLTATAYSLTYGQAGTFGQAIGFNGTSGYGSVPHSAPLEAGTFSLSLWVYVEADNARTLIDKRTAGSGYGLAMDAQRRLVLWISGNACIAPVPLMRETWMHIAATYDGTRMRLYLDGRQVCEYTPMGANPASAAPLVIGRAYSGGGFFRGMMDEIAYHNRALGAQDVAAHYRAGKGTLAIQVRSAASTPLDGVPYVGPDGTPDTWFTAPSAGNLLGVVSINRYFQYRGQLRSEDHRFSPMLHGVSVAASRYPEEAPWVTPTEATGYPFLGELIGFEHTRTFNAGTDVRYQISGDVGMGASNRWFYYNTSSKQWTPQEQTNALSVYNLETSPITDVVANIGKLYSQIYNTTGGVFRFKAFLKSGGDQQVAVSNVTVTASRGRVVVVAPNGEERGDKALITAVPTTIHWSWAGTVSDNLELAYSINGYAGPFTVISAGLAKGAGGTNALAWATPQPPSGVSGFTNVVVRIRDLDDATVIDYSDCPFEIVQRFKVIVPNGGERWYVGETNAIRWASANDLSVRSSIYIAPDGVNFYANEGGMMIEFAATNQNASTDNLYTWATPRNMSSLLSTNAKIRIQAPNGSYADDSDSEFALVGVVVTTPTAGQKVKRGDPFIITWRSIDAGTNVHVDVSLDGGVTYAQNIYSFVDNADGDNSLVWDVTQAESDTTVLRVRSLSDGRIIGYSEPFTIAGVDVLAPDGGEEWLTGTTQTIRWVAGGAGDTVSLFYTDLYAETNTVWLPIAQNVPNTLSYAWVVSERVSPQARVKIQSDEDANLNAISGQNFSIAGVRVTYPNLFNDTLVMGSNAVMTHAGAPMGWQRVKLEISYDRAETWQALGPSAEEWSLRQWFEFRPTFPSSQTKVRATVLDATQPDHVTPMTNVFDLSDEYFTVEGIIMEAPLAGSTHTMGTQTEIGWVSAGAGPSVASIYYSREGTNTFQLIEQDAIVNPNYPGRSSYAWVVPPTLRPSNRALVKVVWDNYSAISQPFTLRGIRITSPTNGVVWTAGTQRPISWEYAGLHSSASGPLSLSLDGGSTVTNLDASAQVSVLLYNWLIDPEIDPSTNAILQLRVDASPNPADVGFTARSDRFTIKGIKIVDPAPGGAMKLGETNTIAFIAAAAGDKVTITYSADGGLTYDPVPVVADLPISTGSNTYNWAVELDRMPSTNAVIKVTGTADSKVSGAFRMGGIRVDRPLAYDIWAVGENNAIAWVAQVAEPVFNIDLVYEDNTTLSVAQNVAGTSRVYPLPASAMRDQESLSNVVLRVSDRQGTATAYSAPFRLVSQPIIEVVSPAEGEYLRVGDEVQVTWIKGGSMNAEDFTVWFLGDGIVTTDVTRAISFNSDNNTFSMPWVVPDKLGPTQIMVTNSANSLLTAFSGNFNIVGSFELTYPNGELGESPVYANQTKSVIWRTQGTVSYVDLYYKLPGGVWIKANTTPIDNNPRPSRYQSSFQWTAPTLRADGVMLRVQDASYPDPDLFDGSRLGPYDDTDHPFDLKYFLVTWVIGYMEEDLDTGVKTLKELDKLSVTDSAGWSITGLESPFVTNYPYGQFDTVWYRQFFNDKVDFRWLSDRDQTRTLIMQPSDTEPDANVMATFVYSPSQTNLTIHSWIERGGRIVNNPDSTTVRFFDQSGTSIHQLTSSTVLADGFFRIEWDIASKLADGTLRVGRTYLARVEVTYNRVIYSAAVTYTLSLSPEFETVESIKDSVLSLESNLVGRVSGLTTNLENLASITTNFAARAMDSLSTLTNQSGAILTNVTDMVTRMDDLTNTLVAPLAALTNQMVEVFGPTMTNMAAQVEAIQQATAGDRARILSRPTTVQFGSTNTIMYKTARMLDPGMVRLTVEGTSEQQTMLEMVAGIYSADVIADWGLGTFMISCSDPTASDRMILEVVVAGAGALGGLAGTVETLESQMTNMFEVMRELSDPTAGVNATLSDINQNIATMESALSGGGAAGGAGSGGASAAASALEALLGGGDGGADGTASLLQSLSGMTGRMDEIFGSASEAAKFAMSARNEASTAASAARELKAMFTGEYSMEAAMERLDVIRRSVDSVDTNVGNIPQALGVQRMQDQLLAVARQITEMARQNGFDDYEVTLKGSGEGAGGEGQGSGGRGEAAGVGGQESGEPGVGPRESGVQDSDPGAGTGPGTGSGAGSGSGDTDEASITVLNQNMNQVKVSLEFMQRVLDEKMNEPVVQESWIGVE